MPYEIVQVINVWELNGKCIIKFANAYLAQLFGHGGDSDVGLEEAKVPQVPFLTPGPTCRRLATLLPEQSPTHGRLRLPPDGHLFPVSIKQIIHKWIHIIMYDNFITATFIYLGKNTQHTYHSC